MCVGMKGNALVAGDCLTEGLGGKTAENVGVLGGGGRLASCYLVADAAEAIIGDVQPRALFQEEGIAHSLVRTFAVDARSIVTAD